MAFVEMAYAQSGEPASSREYNKVVDNVKDLHQRVTANTDLGSDLDSRVAALEASTGVGYSIHMFSQASPAQTIPGRQWTRVRFDNTAFSEPSDDITLTPTTDGGTMFTLHRGGVWRVQFTGSMAATSTVERVLLLVGEGTSDRRVYSEIMHAGDGDDPYSDSISGLILVPPDGEVACWVWHTQSSGMNTNILQNRTAVSFEWRAPYGQTMNDPSNGA